MKKKTFEEVEAAFKSRDFQLLSTEYIGVHSHLEYICDKGHQTKINFKHLQNGHGCLECSGNKKKTIEEVRERFKSRGFTLLSTEYKNCKSLLKYLCSNGHNATISLSDLTKDHGCAECVGLKKKTIEEVEAAFTQRGFTLLSTNYKNSFSLLEYICGKGHQTKISFSHLQNGKGCAECAGLKKKTIEEVRELFATRGYSLLSNDYSNNNSPLEYTCDQGHQTNICFSSLQNGKGCAECAGKKKKTMEEVRLAFNQRGYSLLSNDYSNNNSPLEYICDKGHQSNISFKHLVNGHGCASCAEYGFNPNKTAILYYLRFQFEGNFYYKIGITNNTTSKRFQSEKTSYTIVKETAYSVGKDARDKEKAILKKFSSYRYKGKPFLTMRGDTELFTKDVLQLDDSILKLDTM